MRCCGVPFTQDAVDASLEDSYSKRATIAFGDEGTEKEVRLPPRFGGVIDWTHHSLTEEGIVSANRLLSLFALLRPDIAWAPAVVDLVGLLLCELSEAEAFYVLEHLMSRDPVALPIQREEEAMLLVLPRTLVALADKAASKRLEASDADLHPVIRLWLRQFFVGHGPVELSLRCVDLLLLSGMMDLVALAAALIARASSAADGVFEELETMAALQWATSSMNAGDVHRVIATAMSDFLPKLKSAQKELGRSEVTVKDAISRLSYSTSTTCIYCLPKISPTSTVVAAGEAEMLWHWLPQFVRIREAVRVFSSEVDGTSLKHLGVCIADASSSVSVLLFFFHLAPDLVVGAYVSALPTGDPAVAFGDGISFVFTLRPSEKVYRWASGCRVNVAVMDKDELRIGLDSAPAILLRDGMEVLESNECATFKSPRLHAGESEGAQILKVEVYGL